MPGTDFRARRRGSVLVLAVVLVAVLALIATAFMISSQTASQASVNSLRGLQAEAACRTGLAAAIAKIQAAYSLGGAICLYDSAGITDAWRSDFYDAAGPDLCPDSWVRHYDSAAMTAKRMVLPLVAPGDPPELKELKRTRGYSSDYFVAVADLDGKLRVNPKNWSTLIAGDDPVNLAKLQDMLRCCLSADVASEVRDHTQDIWSIGAMRAAYNPANAAEMTELESFLTPYPRRLAELIPANGRPPVNVNTARREVLKAIVRNVPGFDGTMTDEVADKLVEKRPFANRQAMETALLELGSPLWPDPCKGVDAVLTEKQLNDLLNSLAGDNSLPGNASNFDDADNGVYKFDFDGNPPVGEHESDDSSATWGTEAKFSSRFFHIYVMGRTFAGLEPDRILALRRLHAVYDTHERRVLWSRWHFELRPNTGE